mmetsp:Transcript_80452/g.232418  ORF Transcript_80452/g.232418 Transcript_80452/m.232418 type:complete len:357 (-) Transcript_80452:544-1614(-)
MNSRYRVRNILYGLRGLLFLLNPATRRGNVLDFSQQLLPFLRQLGPVTLSRLVTESKCLQVASPIFRRLLIPMDHILGLLLCIDEVADTLPQMISPECHFPDVALGVTAVLIDATDPGLQIARLRNFVNRETLSLARGFFEFLALGVGEINAAPLHFILVAPNFLLQIAFLPCEPGNLIPKYLDAPAEPIRASTELHQPRLQHFKFRRILGGTGSLTLSFCRGEVSARTLRAQACGASSFLRFLGFVSQRGQVVRKVSFSLFLCSYRLLALLEPAPNAVQSEQKVLHVAVVLFGFLVHVVVGLLLLLLHPFALGDCVALPYIQNSGVVLFGVFFRFKLLVGQTKFGGAGHLFEESR